MSGCVRSTPVSMMPTVTSLFPRARSQASGRCTSAPAASSMCHCSGSRSSLGSVANRRTGSSAMAARTVPLARSALASARASNRAPPPDSRRYLWPDARRAAFGPRGCTRSTPWFASSRASSGLRVWNAPALSMAKAALSSTTTSTCRGDAAADAAVARARAAVRAADTSAGSGRAISRAPNPGRALERSAGTSGAAAAQVEPNSAITAPLTANRRARAAPRNGTRESGRDIREASGACYGVSGTARGAVPAYYFAAGRARYLSYSRV